MIQESLQFMKKGKKVKNDEGIFSVRRTLDSLGRTRVYENLDSKGRLTIDGDFGAKYVYELNENHKKTILFRPLIGIFEG